MLIAIALGILVVGIVSFLDERNENGRPTWFALIFGSVITSVALAVFAVHWYVTFLGYPADSVRLTANATYEVVQSKTMDGKQVLVLKEPTGDLRLFTLETNEIEMGDTDSARFLKAIKFEEDGNTKMKLVSLVR